MTVIEMLSVRMRVGARKTESKTKREIAYVSVWLHITIPRVVEF